MEKRRYLKWTEKEISYLKSRYPDEDKLLIINRLRNRKWNTISKKAEKLGIQRIIKKNDLSILLNESLESYYWLGFLIADGNFEARRASIAVSKKI